MTRPENIYNPADQHSIRAVISGISDVHGDIRVFRLHVPEGYHFKAGQYAYVSFNDMPPRPYSIASRPDQTELEIHIKRGTSEVSQYIMAEAKEGDPVRLSAPCGRSVYDCALDMPILAIAGGLGIAPLKAAIEEALYREHAYPIALYWGTAHRDEQYLRPYFEDLAAAHEQFSFAAVSGGAVTDTVLARMDDLSDMHIFLSGSMGMISHAIPLLLDKKADRSKISYDQHPEAGNLTA